MDEFINHVKIDYIQYINRCILCSIPGFSMKGTALYEQFLGPISASSSALICYLQSTLRKDGLACPPTGS